MRGNNQVSAFKLFSLAERCKNILTANSQAVLNTINADASPYVGFITIKPDAKSATNVDAGIDVKDRETKDEIYSSKVQFFLRNGIPYLWIKEGDMHNMNIMIDERGSLSVLSPFPGPLLGLLRSLNMVPPRVALAGDLLGLSDKKVRDAIEFLKETIFLENKEICEASRSVSSILSSASKTCRSVGENLQKVLDVDEKEKYEIYKFDIRSCSYIDGNGENYEVEPNDFKVSKSDVLAPLTGKLIDGINQNEERRRALMLLCLIHFNVNARIVKDSMSLPKSAEQPKKAER
ncbi:hypothetical protein ZOSMA_128G00210 [Zostera marina]|uniref:Uncharacterized protein n=1 Tax=Zostera marina TaxID=29655 RepID=A0A0K9Q1Y3_ZOSMR|nr:hypothetical protein ZOSMA_128G00210 [Zostera marina]